MSFRVQRNSVQMKNAIPSVNCAFAVQRIIQFVLLPEPQTSAVLC